jgi:hypothetical protein
MRGKIAFSCGDFAMKEFFKTTIVGRVLLLLPSHSCNSSIQLDLHLTDLAVEPERGAIEIVERYG